MKNKQIDISQRLGKTKGDDLNQYMDGFLDIIDFMRTDLNGYLENEGRHFGIITKYLDTISSSFSKLHKKVTEKDIEIYGKILYLLKPSIQKEFKFLSSKNLSKADSAIVIIHKLTSILWEYKSYENKKELGSIKKVIDSMFDNIRNKAKLNNMFFFSDLIRRCLDNMYLGKYRLDIFSFEELKITDNEDTEKNSIVELEKETNEKIEL